MKLVVSLLLAIGCLVALPSVALAETYVVDSTADEADENSGDEECETLGGVCTLRAAIEESNESTGTPDLIHFAAAFNGEGKDTIALTKALPEIDDPVHIDGDSGGQCTTAAGPKGPCAGVSGPSASLGLIVETDEVTIEGLAVTGALIGINVRNESTEFTARDNWVGVKLDGTVGENNTGIFVDPGSDEASIGGTAATDRNVVANNGVGLDIEGASFARVQGNYFGVTPAGTAAAANAKDIEVTDSTSGGGFTAIENEIGATVEGKALESAACDGGCNVISGASSTGLDLNGNGSLSNEAPATGPTLVHGNYVGLGSDGTTVLANATFGILAGESESTTLGGPTNGDANYIAGGGYGIYHENGEGLEALGNAIGSGPAGNVTSPGVGVFTFCLKNTTPPVVAGNVIRMEGGVGVEARFGGAEIESNFIEGAQPGVLTKAGPGPAGSNLIRENVIGESPTNGILIEDNANEVLGNSIFGSGAAGIRVKNPVALVISTGNLIGGNTAASENTILESGGPAIQIVDESGNTEEESENEVARNNGKGNTGLFIDLVGTANGSIQPPEIGKAALTGASGGGAVPGATVRVFRKKTAEAGELASFLGEAEADGSGNWSVTYGAAIPGETRIAATQTNSEGGTSELAFATTEPEPKKEGEEKDTTPPQTKIVKGPKAKTHARKVKFKFTSSEAGSTFKCKLDKKPVKSCKSPKTYKKLKPGKHLFKVWAIDKAGNKDPTPAKRKFKILS